MKRKIISIMLALAMCLSLLPAVSLPASAASPPHRRNRGIGDERGSLPDLNVGAAPAVSC